MIWLWLALGAIAILGALWGWAIVHVGGRYDDDLGIGDE